MGGQLRKGLRRFEPGNPQTPEAVDDSFDWKRPKKRLLKKTAGNQQGEEGSYHSHQHTFSTQPTPQPPPHKLPQPHVFGFFAHHYYC